MNDRMPRLNMVRIKADHAAANDLRTNMIQSAKGASGEATVESSGFLMNDKEKLRMLKPVEHKKMLASVVKKTDASALIASYFGSTDCQSGNTSDQRRNIEVCNVESDDSSEFEDRKVVATSIFS